MQSGSRGGRNLRSLTLDEWADRVYELYGHHNKDRTIPEIWLSVIQFASEIAEGIRRLEIFEMDKAMAHTFFWFCTFYNQCNRVVSKYSPFFVEEKLWKVIGFKYPHMCGRCRSNPCDCGKKQVEIEFGSYKDLHHPDLERARRIFRGSTYTLKDWMIMFSEIFSNANYRMDLEDIGFHLMEEVGEVSKAIRQLSELKRLPRDPTKREKVLRRRERLKESMLEELGDVFSFLNGLVVKLAFITMGITGEDYQERLKGAEDYLQNIIVKEYEDDKKPEQIRCPDCEDSPCTCEFYF